MNRYTVQHRYTAVRDGRRIGPWEPDTEVELSDHDAEWVNRDSPGTLTPVDPPEPEPEPEPDKPKPERAQPAAGDRRQRRTANRGT